MDVRAGAGFFSSEFGSYAIFVRVKGVVLYLIMQ